MQKHSCALISVLLIHSFHRDILLPSGRNSPRGFCKISSFDAEQRAKETRCAPAERQEVTATVSSNFALVRLGQHQLTLGHSNC